jgi:hypothetical protein
MSHKTGTRGGVDRLLAGPQPPQLVQHFVEPLALNELHGVKVNVVLPDDAEEGTMLLWCSRAAARASRWKRSR